MGRESPDTPVQTDPVVTVGWTEVGNLCHVPMLVGNVSCSALVDTGSTATLVRPDVVPAGTVIERTSVKLQTVTGETASMRGRGTFVFTLGNLAVTFQAWVAEVRDPCILGLDFLRFTGCVLNLSSGVLVLPGGQGVQLTSPSRQVSQVMPTYSASAHPVGITPPAHVLQSSPPVLAADQAVPPPCQLPGDLNDRMEAIRDIWGRNCAGLDDQQQMSLWQLLWEFNYIFALSDDEVGLTHLVEHHIDTGEARPIKVRPRRLPLVKQEAADQEVRAMLKAGIIEASNSPWSSAVVMVPKKKGSRWRFCVDYRPLNQVTRKDCYPIPRVDETLDLVSGSAWFSSLDLRSGYWQVPLTPESRPKTAFSTGRGHWQFKVLSFGLCNAPGTFERLMDSVLADVPHQECVVYLDDVLAHGKTFQAALDSLRVVLEKIAAAGLKLHPGKCHFMRREVEFLGHRLSSEGISTLEEKVRAIRDWPVPNNQTELKSFLGLASYYRRFVRGFSCIGAPLFQLLQKNQPFSWSVDCQRAFTALQQALVQAPVLTPPDPAIPFLLDTDASNVGMGAVLSQKGPEGERVVAYFSRVFNKSERRYCVTRRELLAVVTAARHFKYYLCGVPFTIRTDHAALKWLMSFREPEGQVARWLEELQSFNFTVEHRPGAQHANADALSRRPCALSGCSYCDRRDAREAQLRGEEAAAEPKCCALQVMGTGEWAARQEEDVDLRLVRQWVHSGQRPPWEAVSGLSVATKGLWSKFNVLRLSEGVLQRAWKEPATGEERWQVVVPKAFREAVLGACHGGAGTGHFGSSKTLRRLRQGFYWGQHRRDVEDFCRRCDECAAHKGPLDQSRAPLQQQASGAPMERVGVDIMGPFPETDSGNKYVLCAMDYFTKWPEAYALPNQEAETVADALIEGMFSRFGAPEAIHSDQGRNFESKVFAALCERLGIQKTRTTPLHPQSDGLVERFNLTMQQQLAILTADHQRDWDRHIPFALMAYRSAVQSSTNCTPALLMLGREIRTPAEMAFE